MADNAAIAEGLREYANFLEAHPELPPVYIGTTVFTTWGRDQKNDLRTVARAFGHAVKDYSGGNLFLKKEFTGGLTLTYVADRNEVCERIQVGTKIEPEHIIAAVPEQVIAEREVPVYEWKCLPILGKPPVQIEAELPALAAVSVPQLEADHDDIPF